MIMIIIMIVIVIVIVMIIIIIIIIIIISLYFIIGQKHISCVTMFAFFNQEITRILKS